MTTKSRYWLSLKESGFVVYIFGRRIALGYETTKQFKKPELIFAKGPQSRGIYIALPNLLISAFFSPLAYSQNATDKA